jgi:hypothetical protein
VTAAQAGDQLQCECGQRIEVPTLRHLAALERMDEAAPRRAKNWGMRQGIVFLGASIIAIAAVCLLVLQLEKPERIHEQLIQTNIESMSPADVWRTWPILEHGIRRSLYPGEVSVMARNLIDIHTWEQLRATALVVGGIGVLLVAIGLFIVRPPRRKTSVA